MSVELTDPLALASGQVDVDADANTPSVVFVDDMPADERAKLDARPSLVAAVSFPELDVIPAPAGSSGCGGFALFTLAFHPLRKELRSTIYLQAAGELFVLYVLLSWAITAAYNPSYLVSNPIKSVFGYNNVCVVFDTMPAAYVALPLLTAYSFCGLRYAFVDTLMHRLLRQRMTACQMNFTYVANILFGLSCLWLPIWVLVTPTENVVFHSVVFLTYMFVKFLATVATVNNAKNTTVSIFTWVWLSVFGLDTLLLIICASINLAGYDYSRPDDPQTPTVPYQLQMTLDYAWFVLMPMGSFALPADTPIGIHYSTIAPGDSDPVVVQAADELRSKVEQVTDSFGLPKLDPTLVAEVHATTERHWGMPALVALAFFNKKGYTKSTMYLQAAGETYVLILLLSGFVTLGTRPDYLSANPIRDIFGYDTLCVLFDTEPASYVVLPLFVLYAYCAMRFCNADIMRLDLERLRLSNCQYLFAFEADHLYGLFCLLLPLMLIAVPTDDVAFHLGLFYAFLLSQFFVMVATVNQSPGPIHWLTKLWLVVFGVSMFFYSLFAFIDYVSYDFTVAGTQTPVIPWPLMLTVEVLTFICLPLFTVALPPQATVVAHYIVGQQEGQSSAQAQSTAGDLINQLANDAGNVIVPKKTEMEKLVHDAVDAKSAGNDAQADALVAQALLLQPQAAQEAQDATLAESQAVAEAMHNVQVAADGRQLGAKAHEAAKKVGAKLTEDAEYEKVAVEEENEGADEEGADEEKEVAIHASQDNLLEEAQEGAEEGAEDKVKEEAEDEVKEGDKEEAKDEVKGAEDKVKEEGKTAQAVARAQEYGNKVDDMVNEVGRKVKALFHPSKKEFVPTVIGQALAPIGGDDPDQLTCCQKFLRFIPWSLMFLVTFLLISVPLWIVMMPGWLLYILYLAIRVCMSPRNEWPIPKLSGDAWMGMNILSDDVPRANRLHFQWFRGFGYVINVGLAYPYALANYLLCLSRVQPIGDKTLARLISATAIAHGLQHDDRSNDLILLLRLKDKMWFKGVKYDCSGARLDEKGLVVKEIFFQSNGGMVITPDHPAWQAAKMHLAACAIFSVPIHFHSWVHFVLPDLVAVGVWNDIPHDSVLYNLLFPHFKFTMMINQVRNPGTGLSPILNAPPGRWYIPWLSFATTLIQFGATNSEHTNWFYFPFTYTPPEHPEDLTEEQRDKIMEQTAYRPGSSPLDQFHPALYAQRDFTDYHKFQHSYYLVIQAFVKSIEKDIERDLYDKFIKKVAETLPQVANVDMVDLLALVIWQVSVVHSGDHYTIYNSGFDAYGCNILRKDLDPSGDTKNMFRSWDIESSMALSRCFGRAWHNPFYSIQMPDVDYAFKTSELKDKVKDFKAALQHNDDWLKQEGMQIVPLKGLSFSLCW